MNTQQLTYTPTGVCAREFTITINENKITNFNFIGGCHGNLQGLGALMRGMDVAEAIERLEGIRCQGKPTSCPDQVAQMLKQLQD